MRPETEAALDALRAAVSLLHGRRGVDRRQEKAPLDYATGTDVAVERLLAQRLRDAFPTYGVLGEESGHDGSRSTFWVIDPICGTANYAAGLPIFNVNVALVEDGQVTAAVVLEPAAEQLYRAERGAGAFASTQGGGWRLMQASAASGIVSVDFGHSTGTGQVDAMLAVLGCILRRRLWGVRVMVTSLVMAWLADGRLAGHLVDAVNPWDMCAGALLCREAGAAVTDFDGRPWRWDSPQLVCAADAATHAQLLRLIATPSE